MPTHGKGAEESLKDYEAMVHKLEQPNFATASIKVLM